MLFHGANLPDLLLDVYCLFFAGADLIIVGGMGARPMGGFAGVGTTGSFADRNRMKTVPDAFWVLLPVG
jgi:hypothetical protein